MSATYEIAIQKILPEHAATYPETRAAFLTQLQARPGHQADWTLRSFFTMPEPDDAEVLVGITRWSSLDAFAAASDALGSTDLARRLFGSVQMKAFVRVHTPDGSDFRLEDALTSPDAVVEVAIRRPKPGVTAAQYEAAHDAFFALVRAQPGFLFDQELVDADGARAVLIGWRCDDDFHEALGTLQHREEMGAFFARIDVQAYQATTPV